MINSRNKASPPTDRAKLSKAKLEFNGKVEEGVWHEKTKMFQSVNIVMK